MKVKKFVVNVNIKLPKQMGRNVSSSFDSVKSHIISSAINGAMKRMFQDEKESEKTENKEANENN